MSAAQVCLNTVRMSAAQVCPNTIRMCAAQVCPNTIRMSGILRGPDLREKDIVLLHDSSGAAGQYGE